jgi:hypothetical protein
LPVEPESPSGGLLLKVSLQSVEQVFRKPEWKIVILLQTQLDALTASFLPVRSEELASLPPNHSEGTLGFGSELWGGDREHQISSIPFAVAKIGRG